MKRIAALKVHYRGTDGKIRLSSVDYWRLVNPYSHVAKNMDWEIDFYNDVVGEGDESEDAWNEIGKKYDYIVTSYTDAPKAYAYLKATAHQWDRKTVMDLDDNIFEVDEMNPARIRYYEGSKPLQMATKILIDQETVSTSTKHLAKVLAVRRRAPVHVLPNYIDPNVYRYYPKKVEKHDGIIIGYQGSTTHYTDLVGTKVLYALQRILNQYKQVKVMFVGMIMDDLYDYFPKDRLIIQGGERDHTRWIKLWQKMPFDIGIAPLVDTSFNHAKSPIKYYEYALRKIPAVYSFVEPYMKKATENETGFFARDEEEWYEKLSWLVENEVLRKRMADDARKDVLDNYTIQAHWREWLNVLQP